MVEPRSIDRVLRIHSEVDHIQDRLQTELMMRRATRPPTTMNSLPSRVMMVGVIEDSGRFAG